MAIDTIHTFTVLRGGPEANLNGAVLGLAALHATGPYRVRGRDPRTVLHVRFRPSARCADSAFPKSSSTSRRRSTGSPYSTQAPTRSNSAPKRAAPGRRLRPRRYTLAIPLTTAKSAHTQQQQPLWQKRQIEQTANSSRRRIRVLHRGLRDEPRQHYSAVRVTPKAEWRCGHKRWIWVKAHGRPWNSSWRRNSADRHGWN